MRINGKEIRDRMKAEFHEEVAAFKHAPHLAVISVGQNPVIRGFVNLKKKFAEDIGVVFTEDIFSSDVSFLQIQKRIEELNRDLEVTGIIVQLPLPVHLDVNVILNMICLQKDVDVLSQKANVYFEKGESLVLTPVVAAVAQICREAKVEIQGRKALVLGHGRLVGAPVAVWLKKQGADVTVIDEPLPNLGNFTKNADIIVCGAGVPWVIKPEMLKHGVVLLDAGTSEDGGVIVGDVDPRCEEIASVFTPVPGGIGPVTVAMIFKNLLILHQKSVH